MTKSEFEELKKQYLMLGGDERLLKSLQSPTLKNEAKLKYELRKLNAGNKVVESTIKQTEKALDYRPEMLNRDLISQYPPELHEVYIQRKQAFLEACSLKMKLNKIPENSMLQAAKLQWQIWDTFQKMDKASKVLNHFREHKRIMPTETKEDFSQIPEKKLTLKLRNLRSNKSKRMRTIKKLKEELPPPEDANFKTKLNTLNKKLEILAELDLQIEKLTELINDE
ncbi:hypothetical protein ACT4R9_05520 [Ornithobacterium rhinotracheale]|uniref:hypothetical protein n=2 Tax=Ornithobacterium rhinotracheale TaxID=28251 RepID=UPI003FA4CE64